MNRRMFNSRGTQVLLSADIHVDFSNSFSPPDQQVVWSDQAQREYALMAAAAENHWKLVSISKRHLHYKEKDDYYVPLLPDEKPEPPPTAPAVGWAILALTCSRDQLDVVAGDIEEDFCRYARERGKAAAYWWFWVQIVKSFAHLAIRVVQKALPITDLFKKFSG